MIGETLGSYRIDKELGHGGMGAVYVGTHVTLGRRAAIKVLLPEMSGNHTMVERFFREAKAATAIDHPGIIEVYDYGITPTGCGYIVMELLAGESLGARLKQAGKLPAETVVTISRQIASALSAAHSAGIIHRDLKPDNVFLIDDPEVPGGKRIKLLDFGIAKLMAPSGDLGITHPGSLMGTPYYMSPEQCQGADLVDTRSDLYSLGCMMFEMLTGHVPYRGAGLGDVIAAHLHAAIPQLSSIVAVPRDVELLVARLLAKQPEHRVPSADALIASFTAIPTESLRTPAVSKSLPPAPTITMPPTIASALPTLTVPAPRTTKRVLIGVGVGLVVIGFYAAMWFAMR